MKKLLFIAVLAFGSATAISLNAVNTPMPEETTQTPACVDQEPCEPAPCDTTVCAPAPCDPQPETCSPGC